jgi:hypothetical protein
MAGTYGKETYTNRILKLLYQYKTKAKKMPGVYNKNIFFCLSSEHTKMTMMMMIVVIFLGSSISLEASYANIVNVRGTASPSTHYFIRPYAKVKLYLRLTCLTEHHAIEAYWGGEV